MKVVDASGLQASSQIDSPRDPQQYILKDLTPGATYQLQLFTIYDHKESVAYISKNFTTSKSYIFNWNTFLLNTFLVDFSILLDIFLIRPDINFSYVFISEPSTPGKFIVWFRNETTLLVLWQPSYPASVFTHYKVCIYYFLLLW